MRTQKNCWQKTEEDLRQKLERFGRCCVLRCTGFGKTWLASALTKDYNKIIYVYPSEVIKDTAEKRIIAVHNDITDMEALNKITFISYSWLSLHYNDKDKIDKRIKGADLIIFDECHLMGGEQVKIACAYIFNKFDEKTHFIGVTATIERQDSFDVVEQFFNNITTYSYTLHDAIQEGLIKKPVYCYCTHMALDKKGNISKINDDMLQEASLNGQDIKNPMVRNVIKARAIEAANIFNMDNIIRSVCDEYDRSNDYMKFICFFSTTNQLNNKAKSICAWFQQAYPEKKVNMLIINSSTEKYRKNVNKLDTLIPRKDDGKDVIDLIFCVDMLNLGYHVNNLTGVLMYRATESTIIYIQQLGRALSSGAEQSCIVFDVVDNLHRKALFDRHKRKKYKEDTEESNSIGSNYELQPHNGLQRGKHIIAPINENNLTTDAIKELHKLQELRTEQKLWKVHPTNLLQEMDLLATNYEATYRELIAKTVAEPMVLNCARVIELHLKRWCDNHHIPYPCTIKEMESAIESGGICAFRELMKEKITDNNLDYPLFDAQSLLALGKESPILDMDIFTTTYGVTVNNILDVMGIS